MASNGQPPVSSADGQVLHWPGQVVSALELRQSLNGQRELVVPPRAILTPAAAEHLRDRGVRITRRAEETPRASSPGSWGYAEERPHPFVKSAVQALAREGLHVGELPVKTELAPSAWARAVAECVARGACRGGVIFCEDSGLVCCVANKLPGVRAVATATVVQAARASSSLGANLVAVEVVGRTFFEVRQILRTLCGAGEPSCPPGVACTLKELDGHAHR